MRARRENSALLCELPSAQRRFQPRARMEAARKRQDSSVLQAQGVWRGGSDKRASHG
jgi:membrane carboxypeptidase/penicillin-binding protein